jgi:hypothetical protein
MDVSKYDVGGWLIGAAYSHGQRRLECCRAFDRRERTAMHRRGDYQHSARG